MYDGKNYDAKLIGYDESNDVAVLKIEAENLVPVVLGNEDSYSFLWAMVAGTRSLLSTVVPGIR